MRLMASEAAFSDLLREQRRTARYSQEELAERAGLSVGAVAALEQGVRRAPYRDTVSALAKALGMSDSAKREFEEAAARARHRVRRDDAVLPVAMTTFVERNEVEELAALLADHRLVTITGPGGVGKTRVAIELARRSDHFFDQTMFVDLLPVRDGDMVAPYVAARLHIASEADDVTGIVRFFHQRRSLLVIDNCEHVIDEAAELIRALVQGSPMLTILATSREPLALSAELAYRLPSMDVAAASALFVARAQAADPSLKMDPLRLEIVAEICRELNGIPLAIELAASRLSTLGFEELRKRLRSGSSLAGNRDFPPRHQTMNATIAWSYDLLSENQRLLFRRLSVFVGGFTLDAAETVCADETLPAAVIGDELPHLVEKSLINVEHLGISTRYVFLDTIRVYAWNLLAASNEIQRMMLRLMDWLNGKTALVDSNEFPEHIIEERPELDNVAGVVIWAESTGDPKNIVAAAKLLIGFRLVWNGTHRQLELRTLTQGLLEYISDDEEPAVVGRLLHMLLPHITQIELATLGPRAIDLLTRTGQKARAANIHARLAQAAAGRGDIAAAEDHLSSVDRLLSDREARSTTDRLLATIISAYARILLGNYSGARALLQEAEIPPGNSLEVDATVVLAEIESREGQFDKAIELLTRVADDLNAFPASGSLTAMVFSNLAMYELHRGDTTQANRHLCRGLRALVDLRDLGSLSIAAEYSQYAAALAALSGRLELAIRLLSACDATCQQYGCSTVDDFAYNLATATIEKNVSEEHAQALRVRGARETLFDLLEEFLVQPAAAESAFASSTSSDRPTSVMRSSPN